MITINIYWQDLSKDMQKKLLKVFGENNNWDTIPIAIIEINDETQDVILDSYLGDKKKRKRPHKITLGEMTNEALEIPLFAARAGGDIHSSWR